MEQKIKFIIIGLIAIVAVSFTLNILTIAAKQTVTRERDSLKEENALLSRKVESGLADNQRLQKEISSLNQGIEKLNKEKEEIQKKYDLLDEARTKLVEQIAALKKKQAEEGAQEQPNKVLAGDTYWAGILKQKKDLEWQLDDLRSSLKQAQINNEQLQKEKSSLELEAGNLNREKQDLLRQYEFAQKQLEYNKKMMDGIALELVGEKNDKLQIQDTFKAIKNENTVLRRQLKNLNDRKINLERKLADAQDKNKTLEHRFNEMDILLKDKVLQLDKMSKGVSSAQAQQEGPVELSPIVVRPQSNNSSSSVTALKDKEAKVAAVNRDNNFVIIDLGEDNSARVGDVYQVFNKENKPVAIVEIIEARKSISACDIQRETSPIQVGDKVRLRP